MKPSKIKSRPTSEAISAGVVISSLNKKASRFRGVLAKLSSISSQEDYELCATHLKALKELGDAAEEKRRSIVDPINKGVKEVNGLFKPFTEMVETIVAQKKELMLRWVNRQDKKLEAIEKSFDDGKLSAQQYAGKTHSIAANVSSDVATVRSGYKVIVTDKKRIPLPYLIPDLKAIEQDLRAGRKIPGVKLEKIKSIAL